MTTTEQAAQVAQAALQAPINNLVILLALVALLIMALGGFLVWKFAPSLIGIYKQQANSIEKLTLIADQNSSQAKLAMQSVDKNTSEMVKQTAAIETQTGIIEGQGRDLRSYQTLVSDNLSAHTEQIATNTANIAALKESIDALSKQIKEMLEDKAACADVEERIAKLRDEIVALVTQQQAKKTTEMAIVSPEPANVIADDGGAKPASEAAA